MRTERIEQLPGQFRAIRTWLEAHISEIPDVILAPSEVTALASLKPVSDMLDGLICTWIGIEHLSERTVGLGDDITTIWKPKQADNLRGVAK